MKHVSEQVNSDSKADHGDAQPFPWLYRLFAPPGEERAYASSSISKLPHVRCLSPGFSAFALLTVGGFTVVVVVGAIEGGLPGVGCRIIVDNPGLLIIL